MFDFDRSLFENCQGRTLLCAHRGVSGANIPCNTLPAFRAALMQHADMIELDVATSKDGKHFVFHPGMEKAHLGRIKPLALTKSDKIEKLKFLNQDNCKTFLGINTLEEIFDFLKGKCYINVDKFWTDVTGITNAIRRCGVEKQCIVKTPDNKAYYKLLKDHAPDLMFMPIVHKTDKITHELTDMGINCIGAEVIFTSEEDPVASKEYIEQMHQKGKVVFANAIVYNSRDVLAANHSDDTSIAQHPDKGWGWLLGRGFDIIQTDWCGMMWEYMHSR